MREVTVGIVWLLGAGLAVAAVQVRTIDGRTVQGELSAISADALSLSGGDTPSVPIGDVEAVEFLSPPRPDQESIILIDNTGSFADRKQSGKIKLRAGQHQLGVIYFTAEGASSFRLEVEGPGLSRKQIPPETMFHVEDFKTVKRSKGLDGEGFRLPDQVDDPQPKVSFRVQEWAHANDVQTFNHLRLAPVTGNGTHLGFNLRPKHKQTTNFAIVFQTIVNMAQEGEYTFYLNTVGQGLLTIGALPLEAAITTKPHEEGDWVARLWGDGELTGPASEWSDDHLAIGIKINEKTEPVNVPLVALAELWRYPAVADPSKFDRGREPQDADSVYAKSSTGEVQRVTGRVLGLSSDKLRFEFGGAERTIALERVQGIVWAKTAAPPVEANRAQGVVWLAGGHRVPGLVKSIEPGKAVVATPWGAELTFVAGHIVREELRGGRLVRLSSLQPSAVQETPYLDRVIPWQRDRSLLGSGLAISDRTYAHGIAQHSQSVLEYDLKREYERFQAEVGLLTPDGAKGNVDVRVSADGQTLFERTSLTAKDGPVPIDLDVTGREKLRLEIGFGEQFDVGDHVGWERAAAQEPAMMGRTTLAMILLIASLAGSGRGADPPFADTLVVRDVAVFLQLRNEPRLSDETYFPASLPPGARSRRKLATGDAAKSPQPLGLITFEGSPTRDVELSLQLITARKLAEWPEGQSRSTRLIWTGMQLSKDAKGSNGAKPTEFPDAQWLAPVARSADRMGISVGRRYEQMLLYDLSLKRPLQLTVCGVEGGYFLDVSGEGPIHDVTVLRPAGDGKWVRAEGGSLGAAATTKKDAAKPGPEAAVFDDPNVAKGASAKKKAETKEAAAEPGLSRTFQEIADSKPGEPANPTAADGGKPAEAKEAPPKTEPSPKANVLAGSNGPQSADDVLQPLSQRVAELGLGPVEVDHALRILKQFALWEDQATVIYRLDPAVLDGLLPLDIIPPPQKVIRVGLVIVQGLDPAVEEKVAELIAKLADKSWKVREAAQAAIQEIGPASVPKLKEALKNKDQEVVFRAEQLLEVLDQSGPGGS